MQIISVVRNFEMYNKLVKNNPYNNGAVFNCFDNTIHNNHIPQHYNNFLDNYNYANPDWLVFCHEDFEVKEFLPPKLQNIDKNKIYGSIGREFFTSNLSYILKYQRAAIGQIEESDKTGKNKFLNGVFYKTPPLAVGTLDCQCIIVHSSLVKKYNLRFDKNLSFDLYAEDFCISAREAHNIKTNVLQIKCQHWSSGNVGERFLQQFFYLQQKYSKAKNIYLTTCTSYKIIGRSKTASHFIYFAFKIRKFFYRIKIKNDVYRIKLFGIPIFGKKYLLAKAG
ncbi:MAG: hypothetical protein LBM71_01215 [Elusimicrobiota bacterium]|jgi:hypothetical protein|nr:hypothetical protein [Elusimicrobiota bacterium]